MFCFSDFQGPSGVRFDFLASNWKICLFYILVIFRHLLVCLATLGFTANNSFA